MTLREARDIAGLSRNRLAELADTTTTTIYDIETGRNARPSYETVVRIVRALQRCGLAGITAEQLFPVEDEAAGSVTHADGLR
jgi:DNA-binding XRE family transcriptional regulator